MLGKTILVMARITKENIFNAVHQYKPGLIFGFPTFLLQMINDPSAKDYDLTSLELVSSGGASITPTIESTLMKLTNMRAVLIVLTNQIIQSQINVNNSIDLWVD